MLTKIGWGLAGLAATVSLALLLAVSPASIGLLLAVSPASIRPNWLVSLAGNMNVLMAIIAVPLGLTFGFIPSYFVTLKALAVSIGASLLYFLLIAATVSLQSKYAADVGIQCAVFVALYSLFAALGNQLARWLQLPASAALGTGAFVALLILFPAAFIYRVALPHQPMTDEARLERALQNVWHPDSDIHKFYALNDAAKESFVVGHIDDARQFATELLRAAEDYPRDWNYGNAIHDGNMVLGRIALREGRVEDATHFLLAAGRTRGSPQLDSFGPNMSLAKDMLEVGEREPVLEYFDLCRRFWDLGGKSLDNWAKEVRAGTVPDFGANLVY
jgi:hypothetical protein